MAMYKVPQDVEVADKILGPLSLKQFIFAILFLIAIILIAYTIYGRHIGLFKFAFEPGSFAIYFYIVVVDIFMFSLRQVNLFLGNDNLWKLLIGKFYVPREDRLQSVALFDSDPNISQRMLSNSF